MHMHMTSNEERTHRSTSDVVQVLEIKMIVASRGDRYRSVPAVVGQDCDAHRRLQKHWRLQKSCALLWLILSRVLISDGVHHIMVS
jgi:hypothetical protein